MITTRLKNLSACCSCGVEMSMATGPSEPACGDVTLCVECGCLHVFDDALVLRQADAAELETLKLNTSVWRQVEYAQRAIRLRRGLSCRGKEGRPS